VSMMQDSQLMRTASTYTRLSMYQRYIVAPMCLTGSTGKTGSTGSTFIAAQYCRTATSTAVTAAAAAAAAADGQQKSATSHSHVAHSSAGMQLHLQPITDGCLKLTTSSWQHCRLQ
jgi:hypothetical protein